MDKANKSTLEGGEYVAGREEEGMEKAKQKWEGPKGNEAGSGRWSCEIEGADRLKGEDIGVCEGVWIVDGGERVWPAPLPYSLVVESKSPSLCHFLLHDNLLSLGDTHVLGGERLHFWLCLGGLGYSNHKLEVANVECFSSYRLVDEHFSCRPLHIRIRR